MSEIAILPFETPEKTSFYLFESQPLDLQVLAFKGQLLASFTMFNITDEPYLSDMRSDGWQVFASRMPLDGGLYWLCYIKCDDELEDYYNQNNEVIADGSGQVFYRVCKKPLLLQNVQREPRLPYITTMQRLRFGNQYGLEPVDSISFEALEINKLDRTLTRDEILSVIDYDLSINGLTTPYFLKNADGDQVIGYTFASLIRPMLTEDIDDFEVINVNDNQTTLIAVYQGNLCVDFLDGIITKIVKINGSEYYFGILDLYNKDVSKGGESDEASD